MGKTWPTEMTSEHVAEAIDWVRYRTKERAKLIIAVGAHSVAIAKNRDLDPETAIAILADVQDDIARAIREMQRTSVTHIAMRLQDR